MSSPSYNPQDAIRPMNVGDIVSAGLRLYTTHFKEYFLQALRSVAWMFLPFLALAVTAIFFAIVQNYYALLGLIIPAILVLTFFCLVKLLAGSAVITRLAFGDLSHQPEPIEGARRFTNGRKWGFLLNSLLMGLIFGGIAIAFYIGLFILIFIGAVAIGATGAFASGGSADAFAQAIGNNPIAIIALALIVLVFIIAVIIFFAWLGARFAIPDVPYTIEAEATPAGSIGRCWELTQKHAWRIFLVLFLTALITLPLQIVTSVISLVLQLAFNLSAQSPEASPLAFLAVVIDWTIQLAASIFTIPLWQAMKAAIYFDLRNRREGLGLRLRDS